MKNYDEIAQNLFERRDEYNKEQKAKKSKIRRGIVSTVCVIAVAFAGFGVWKSGLISNKPQVKADLAETEEKTEIITTAQNDKKNGKTEKKSEVKEYADEIKSSTTASENSVTKAVSDSSEVISGVESDCTYGMPSYATPENGTYFLALPVQWSVQKHGSSKKYLLYIDIFKDKQIISDAEKSAELKRLKDAGCDIKKYTRWSYGSDGVSKEYYTQLGGVFTKEQLETLFTGREYAYFFDFMAGSDINPDDVIISDGSEFFEKTTQKGETYYSVFN